MECSKVHNDLFFYLEGSLDEKSNADIKHHLGTCKRCSHFADMLRASLDVIEYEKKVGEDNDFADRIIDELSGKGKKRKTYPLSILRYAAAAAIIIFGVFTGINIARLASGYDQNGLTEMSEETYYLNDMYQEPIESFFLINYEDYE